MEDDDVPPQRVAEVATPPLARETDALRRERSILKWVAGFCAIGGLALGLGVGLTLGALSRDGARGSDRASLLEREAYWGIVQPPHPPMPPMVAFPHVPEPPDVESFHGYTMDDDHRCRTFVHGKGHKIIVQNYGPGCDAHPNPDAADDDGAAQDLPKKKRVP